MLRKIIFIIGYYYFVLLVKTCKIKLVGFENVEAFWRHKKNIVFCCPHNAILACFALGAEGVQIGTAFAATNESSAHENFKTAMCQAKFNSTFLRMKKLVPVRLLDNDFAKKVAFAEESCADKETLSEILGKGRAKEGMLNGNLIEGELEVGQIVSEIKEILSCEKLVAKLISEYLSAKNNIF